MSGFYTSELTIEKRKMIIKNTPIYNNKYSSPQVAKNNCKKGDITFNGNNVKFYSKFALAGVVLAVTIKAVTTEALLIPALRSGDNEKMISKHIGWDKNIRVLASNGQNVRGIVGEKDSYLTFLTDELKKQNINTVEQASGALSKNGYSILLKEYHPLETPDSKLNIFDKTRENKNRFILVFSQDNCEGGVHLTKNADKFSNEMQKIYNISQKNVIRISAKSEEDFKKGLDSVANVISKLKDKSKVELLISATGHGAATVPRVGAEHSEGAMEGFLFNSTLNETAVKQLFEKKLKNIKTLFLINACQSGAWIADNGKTTAKKTLQLFA